MVKTREVIECKGVLLLVSYGCDIPDGKDVLGVRKGAAVWSSFSRCMGTSEDIVSPSISSE